MHTDAWPFMWPKAKDFQQYKVDSHLELLCYKNPFKGFLMKITSSKLNIHTRHMGPVNMHDIG